MSDAPRLGHLGWLDLTVEDAPRLRDFYAAVAGWSVLECPMEGYSDYVMQAPDGEAVAGVCHRRGVNADLPVRWIPYVVVADVDAATATAKQLGADILREPSPPGGMGRTSFVRDPAGAVLALFQPNAD